MTSGVRHLSLAAPAYNEAEHLESLILEWCAYLRSVPQLESYEIVICNDGSTDQTGDLLDRLARDIAELRPVHLRPNRGAAVALASAIRHTTKEWVLLIDSDGQFPLDNLPVMMAAVDASDVRAIHGVRPHKHNSLAGRLGSWASGAVCNMLYRTQYRDFNCALKLVHGPLLRALHLEARGLNYSTEIMGRLIESGCRLREVPIRHQDRRTGQSSMKFVRDSAHRVLFVLYLGVRQCLFRWRVLERPGAPP